MIPLPFLKGKKIGLFGLGKAGASALRALQKSDADIFAWDDKHPPKNGTPIADWPWEELHALVLSPGVPFTHPTPHPVVTLAQKNNVPIICDIELLYLALIAPGSPTDQPPTTIIGITGTNGKSTTTALVGHILTHANITNQVGGNIGTPALDLECLENGVYVLELSSYQLDLLDQTRFNIAVLLNITPDHIDRHGDLAGYVTAKKRIFRHAPDHIIIGTDTEESRSLAEAMPCTKISQDDELPVTKTPCLPGAHNRQNISAAFAICRALGLAEEQIIAGVTSFPGLAHRIERVAEKQGITYINDSKATNAEAAEKALRSFAEPILWIAGGKAKEGGIESLAPYFKNIKHSYLIGEAEGAFADTLTKHHAPFTRCGTLEQAVAQAAKQAATLNQATVLFSPACASFDQFTNFEARGDAFKQAVEKL